MSRQSEEITKIPEHQIGELNISVARDTEVSNTSLWIEPGEQEDYDEPEFVPKENMWYLVKYNLFLALLCAPAGYVLVGNN